MTLHLILFPKNHDHFIPFSSSPDYRLQFTSRYQGISFCTPLYCLHVGSSSPPRKTCSIRACWQLHECATCAAACCLAQQESACGFISLEDLQQYYTSIKVHIIQQWFLSDSCLSASSSGTKHISYLFWWLTPSMVFSHGRSSSMPIESIEWKRESTVGEG